MNNPVTGMLGIEFPLFAFSHCRDVVVAVSKAGGIGVLGAMKFTPEELEEELRWIDAHIDGKPYGVDLVMPSKYVRKQDDAGHAEEYDPEQLWKLIPEGHTRFAHELCDRHGVPPLPEDVEEPDTASLGWSERVARLQLDIALRHSPKIIVNALGVPPADVIARVHEQGIKVGALAGKKEHALKQKAAGVDLIVANGHEAAGHTGDITTMVLVPQVVAAVAPLPVLAAGGIGSGQQMAAAMMLGAAGVWTGSVWLTSSESELDPLVREKLLRAGAHQTARTRCITGKPARHLVTPYTAAWDDPETPDALPMPLQTMATATALQRIQRTYHTNPGALDLITTPAGQVIGLIDTERSARAIVQQFREEFASAAERFERLLG